MDFFMPPGINGKETTKQIREILLNSNLNSYIVCLTAQSEGDFDFKKNNEFKSLLPNLNLTQIKIFDDLYEKPLGFEQINTLMQKIDFFEEQSESDN